ncbi:MAG: hypothetical protein ACLGI6_21665, partial [Gammaproteobacteria bacterium]
GLDLDVLRAGVWPPESLQRGGAVYALTWGRDTTPETADRFAAMGLDFDPATATLRSRARLQVTLVTNPPAPSPCDPPAASGYLGADNQLLRVQVVSFDAATGTGKLLWAYNNGSTLYRCRTLDATTVELQMRPVSAEYQPRVGGVVQLLLAAADLGEGAYAAALTGHWATLATPYDADTRRITLPAALPAVFAPDATNPLFVRLWDQELDFSIGTPVALTGTGLQVTISRASIGETSAGAIALGDYWSFGARPSTPNAVYPERYLAAPQPPDGPRQWVSPLAVLAGTAGAGLAVVDDCRLPFDNLVELTARQPGEGGESCCCITVRPEQAGELQRIIDEAVQGNAGRVTVHLQAGLYALPEPLRIDKRHNGLTLAPCTGVRPLLTAAEQGDPGFSYGMIIVLEAEAISLTGIDFALPRAEFDPSLRQSFERAGANLPLDGWVPKQASVGVHILGSQQVTITDCRFRFPRDAELYFGAAVLLQGANGNVALRTCNIAGRAEVRPDSLLLGICLAPILRSDDGAIEASSVGVLEIEHCLFSRLHVAVLLAGQPEYLGLERNMTRDVRTSFWLLGFSERVGHSRNLLALIDQRANASPSLAKLWSQMRSETHLVFALCSALLIAPGALAIGQTAPREDSIRMRLSLHANHFDASSLPDERGSLDTLVWDLSSGSAQLLVDANTFVNRGELPTLTAALNGAFNITGNVIENRAAAVPGAAVPPALLVQPRDARESSTRFTVTGNTILGSTNLAQFPRAEWMPRLPPDLQALLTWEFFNAIG